MGIPVVKYFQQRTQLFTTVTCVSYFFKITKLDISILLPPDVPKISRCLANSEDPDHMLQHSAASVLSPHCLIRSVCLNT